MALRVRASLRLGALLCALMVPWIGGFADAGATPASSNHLATPVQSGFGGSEDFCAQPPLRGVVQYRSHDGSATMRVAAKGLARNTLVYVNWVNNTVRGYVVGTVKTDHLGSTIPRSLKLFRPGEVRGYKIVLSTASSRTAGSLWPCGPPRLGPARAVTDPKISVSPDTGLSDGQNVTVAASGFGMNQKLFLSECDHAEDATAQGCAARRAVMPFLFTRSNRSGSATFTVHQSAAGTDHGTGQLQTCTHLCVIVATQGDSGAWVVAPIAFGSSGLVNPQGS